MKKLILTLVFATAFTTLSAQTEPVKKINPEFNKWSIELAGGFNKPQTDDRWSLNCSGKSFCS
jgi:OOP family OmpA-OmpF porin